MKNKVNVLVAAVTAAFFSPLAQAEIFGGVEVGYTYDTNFTAAPDNSPKVAENIMTYSGSLGNYLPFAGNSSAWIVKADVAATRLDQFTALDSNSFGLNTGIYHGFSSSNSMTAMVSGYARRFDVDVRDTETYAAQLGFKQKIDKSFWFREGVTYEVGKAQANSNEYSGYAVNGSLNWAPAAPTLLTLGLAHNTRIYDVLVGDVRTSNQATLGLVQQFGKHVYLRGGVTLAANKTNAGSEYDTTIYTAGLGVNL